MLRFTCRSVFVVALSVVSAEAQTQGSKLDGVLHAATPTPAPHDGLGGSTASDDVAAEMRAFHEELWDRFWHREYHPGRSSIARRIDGDPALLVNELGEPVHFVQQIEQRIDPRDVRIDAVRSTLVALGREGGTMWVIGGTAITSRNQHSFIGIDMRSAEGLSLVVPTRWSSEATVAADALRLYASWIGIGPLLAAGLPASALETSSADDLDCLQECIAIAQKESEGCQKYVHETACSIGDGLHKLLTGTTPGVTLWRECKNGADAPSGKLTLKVTPHHWVAGAVMALLIRLGEDGCQAMFQDALAACLEKCE